MKGIILLVLVALGLDGIAQNVDFRGDSARFFKNGGSMEMVIRNKTRDTLGFLYNKGAGITEFRRVKQINDTTFVMGGDTVLIKSAASGGSGLNTLNGLNAGLQTFATPGIAGTAPNWVSSGSAHTLNIPRAQDVGVTLGLVSKTNYDTWQAKIGPGDTATMLANYLNAGDTVSLSNRINQVKANGITAIIADITTSAPDPFGVAIGQLSNTGVTPGTYTNPTITVDSKGRLLFADNGVGGGGSGTDNVNGGAGYRWVIGGQVIRTLFSDGTILIDSTSNTNGITIKVDSSDFATQSDLAAVIAAGNGITDLTGDVTGTGPGSTATTIANDAVTFAKFQNIPTASLIGRYSASTGDAQSITLGSGLSLSGAGVLSASATTYSFNTPLSEAAGVVSIANAAADGSTKGAAAFVAADFTSSSGLIGIDYINGQAANAGTKGFLTAADWTTFNNKQAAGNYITALTGDGTAAGPGSSALTLATVNSNVGSFTYGNFTVNAKGLITAASSGTIDATLTNGSTNPVQNNAVFDGLALKQDAITLTTTGTAGAATLIGSTLNIPQYAPAAYTAGVRLTLTGNQFNVDTLALLAPYQTAINARVKYSDTSTMLTAYRNALNTKLQNITGYITAGSNVTVTGAGTLASPYIIASSGGSGGGYIFTPSDFNETGSTVSIDYTNGQAASGSAKGFLTPTDWNTFNNKQNTITTGSTSQYFRGDLSLATFPTAVSSFTNDAGYLTNITGKVSAGTAISISGAGTTASPYVINSSAVGLTDGDKGDITVGSSGANWNIDALAVGNAEINDVAWSKITSIPTDIVYTNATQTLTAKTLTSPIINVGTDATGDIYYRSAGGAFTRLGIGSDGQVIKVVSGLPAWAADATGGGGGATLSDGDYGDVTVSGTGTSIAIDAGAVSNTKLANMATLTIKGNNTGGTTAPIDLTVAQVNAILPVFTSSLRGLAPPSGGGTDNFLRADGNWAAPASGYSFDADDFDGTTTISIDYVNGQKATTSQPGFLTDTDWDIFNNKQPLITTGTTAQYFRGDLSLATFPTLVSTFTNDAAYLTNITGKVTAGTNISITGSGTAGSPYVVNATSTGLADGDKGDVTVSSSGTVWNIDAGVIGNTELASGIDAVKIADGSVTNAEFQYIGGLTSDAQTQINNKLENITGKVTAGTNVTITGSGTTASPYVVNSSGGGTYTGTTNRISLTGSAFDIAATYVGQTSITTLGTIGTGVWQGTAIGNTYGGMPTGGTAGQMLYKSSSTDYAATWGPAPDFTYNAGDGIVIDGENNISVDDAYIISLVGSGVTDGDKTDITVSSSGTVYTIDNLAVTNAKINDVAYSKLTSIPNAAADGTTKGDAGFTAADFNATSGIISIDYANGQAASSSVNGFLSSTDWSTFNAKQAALVSGTNIKTVNTQSILGSGDLTVSTSLTSTYIGYGNGSVTGEAALTYNATTNKIATDSIGVIQTSTTNLTATGRLIINPNRADYATITGTAELGPGVYYRGIVTADGLTVNEHGFVDGTEFSRAGQAYAAYDAQVVMSGSAAMDHYAGYQQRATFSGSNTLSTYYSFSSAPQITGGTITNLYHFGNPAFTNYSGTITNEYGLYIQSLGATNKWGVWVEDDRSFFGGNVGIGTETPGYPLSVASDGTAIGVLDWVNTGQFLNAAQTKGFNLGYLSSGNFGVIGSQGASSGITFISHNGTSWGYRMTIGVDGSINFPDFSGTGTRGLAVDATGKMVEGSGGSSQWADQTGGISYGDKVTIGSTTISRELTIDKSLPTFGMSRSGTEYSLQGIASGADVGVTGTATNDAFFRTVNTGYSISTDEGTTAAMRFLANNGGIVIPEFAGGGDQLLGVDNNGELKIATGGSGSQWDDVTGGIEYAGGFVRVNNTNPIFALYDPAHNHPFTALRDADEPFRITTAGATYMQALSNDDASAFSIAGFIGSTTPTQPVILFSAYKSNGSTSFASMGSSESVVEFHNGSYSSGAHLLRVNGDGGLVLNTTKFNTTGDQMLIVNDGVVSFQAIPSGGGFTDPMTTNGDIITRISGSSTRLAASTAGYVLTSNGAGNNISWQPVPGNGQDGTYTTLSVVTTNNTPTDMSGSMTISNGEAGLLEITIYAINSTSSSSFTKKIIVPYIGNTTTSTLFGTEDEIITESGVGLEISTASFVYDDNGSGDIIITVIGVTGQSIQWRAEIKKYSVFWSS